MGGGRDGTEGDRRDAILDAACLAIAELGFSSVRIADIAARAGTSTGTIHYHFETKADVLAAAFSHAASTALERHRTAVSRIEDPWERLVFLIDSILQPDRPAHHRWFVWLAFWAEAVHNPAYAPLHAQSYGRWRTLIAEVIADGRTRGAFTGVEPDDAAALLAALFDGVAIQALLDDAEMPTRRAHDLCLAAARALLGL